MLNYAEVMEALRLEALALLRAGRKEEARMLAVALSGVQRVAGKMGGGRLMGSPAPSNTEEGETPDAR